jgi:hypothetical protein
MCHHTAADAARVVVDSGKRAKGMNSDGATDQRRARQEPVDRRPGAWQR